jgi:bifunctional DNase/RNase
MTVSLINSLLLGVGRTLVRPVGVVDTKAAINSACYRVRAGRPGLVERTIKLRHLGLVPLLTLRHVLREVDEHLPVQALACNGLGEEDRLSGKKREVAMTTTTAVGNVQMRIAKVVGLRDAEDEPFHQYVEYVALEEVSGDRQLAIAIGQSEAFSLAARLGGIAWRRPMTYQFVAGLVQALGGRVRQVRIDRVVEETFFGTVEVEGPLGVRLVDARPSDALNLAALVQAPIFAAPEVLQEAEARRAGDSPEALRLRRALAAPPMTVGTVGMPGGDVGQRR